MTGDSNRHFGGRVWWFGKARTEVEQHTQVVVQMIRWYLGDNLDRALKIIIQKGEEAMFRWKRKQERGATREKELEERYFNLWRGTCLTFKSIFWIRWKVSYFIIGSENDDILRRFKCLRQRLVSDFGAFCDDQVDQFNLMCRQTNAFFIQPDHWKACSHEQRIV